MVQEEISLNVISYLALCWPLLHWSGAICAISVEGIMQAEQFCEIILILDLWLRRRCHLKYFLSGALAALVFVGAELFVQFW